MAANWKGTFRVKDSDAKKKGIRQPWHTTKAVASILMILSLSSGDNLPVSEELKAITTLAKPPNTMASWDNLLGLLTRPMGAPQSIAEFQPSLLSAKNWNHSIPSNFPASRRKVREIQN